MAHHMHKAAVTAAAAGIAGLLLASVPAVPAHADDVAFRFSDSRIVECSGMATDTERNYYWAINDTESSGGRIYGVRPNGDTVTSIRFGASLSDTEALAYVNNTFYVGDIGDNNASRNTISVYTLKNAKPGAESATYTRYRFRYPDGAHDAEGMFVTEQGRIFIVTKEKNGAIYAAPQDPSSSGTSTLSKVGTAPSMATDATMLPDGKIAIRTYTSVSILDGSTYKEVASSTIPVQQQGEAVTSTMDGTGLLLGSEGKYSDVLRAAVPSGTASASPSASSSASASASPSSSNGVASANPTSTTTGSTDSSDNPFDRLLGTQSMVLVGAVVAVAAALVVFLRRK